MTLLETMIILPVCAAGAVGAVGVGWLSREGKVRLEDWLNTRGDDLKANDNDVVSKDIITRMREDVVGAYQDTRAHLDQRWENLHIAEACQDTRARLDQRWENLHIAEACQDTRARLNQRWGNTRAGLNQRFDSLKARVAGQNCVGQNSPPTTTTEGSNDI